jgi:hypothetical protein
MEPPVCFEVWTCAVHDEIGNEQPRGGQRGAVNTGIVGGCRKDVYISTLCRLVHEEDILSKLQILKGPSSSQRSKYKP